MAVKENRYIRIEDWNGNVYYPDSVGGGNATSGIIIDSTSVSTDPEKNPYTEGTHTDDPNANGGKSIIITSGSKNKMIVSADITDLILGTVAISMRMKSTLPRSIMQLIQIDTYYEDISSQMPKKVLLNSERLTANDFITGEYTTIPSITDFKGVDTGNIIFHVEVILLPGTNATIYFDMMSLTMQSASGYQKAKVEVDGDIIMIGNTNKVDIDLGTNTVIVP